MTAWLALVLIAGCSASDGGTHLPYGLVDGSGMATYSLDGTNGLTELPAGNQLVPGAALGAGDRFAMDWDTTGIYVAAVSGLFGDETKALVIYLEGTATSFGTAAVSQGMAYLGQTPQLPFTPEYAIAVRRQTDDVPGGAAWSGLYRLVSGTWILVAALVPGSSLWSSTQEIALVLPFALVGDPARLRVVGHCVNGVLANEWKVLVPDTHTPYLASTSGYFEIDLAAAHAAAAWTLR